MVDSKLAHFSPSVLTAVVLLLFAFLADRQHDRVLSQDKWERVGREADAARSQFLRALGEEVASLRSLANALGTVDGLTQSVFDRSVRGAFEGHASAIQAELNPGFQTVLAGPPVAFEGGAASTPERMADGAGPGLLLQALPDAALSGLVQGADGRRILTARSPFLEYSNGIVSLAGTLTLYLDLKDILRKSGIPDPAGQTDFVVTFEQSPAGAKEIVQGEWDMDASPAYVTDVPLPSGRWAILARPAAGWELSFREKLPYRSVLLVIGALIMMPTLVANWYAIERHRTLEEQNAAKARLSSVLKNMPVAVCTYTMPPGQTAPGPDDTIRFFNRDACLRIWGVEAAEAEAEAALLWKTGPHDDYRENFLRILGESAQDLTPWHYSWPIRLKDGARKWIDGRGHPMRLSDGSTRWFNLIVDASAEMEISAELERQKELASLAQKNDSLGKLTGGVAHDFNNLLAVIMGNQELLREELEQDFERRPELREFVDNSLLATERGADLTRKMLSFARRARLEPAVFDLNAIVRETSAWAGRTMPESIRLEFDLGDELPPVRIDRGSTENALLNLMVNARDAMPGGGVLSISTAVVTLHPGARICSEEGLEPGRYLRLTVSDTGEGIPAEILSRVFEPFFTTKPPASGSGLGLSMVHGFMKQSGGCVRVASMAGGGTSFQLFFPALAAAEPVLPEVPVIRPPDGNGKTCILLAEDEADVRHVLMSTLIREGYDVIEAENGEIALDIFRQSPAIDLLLTDIVMPGSMTGIDLAGAARALVPDLPVIMLSGYAAGEVGDGQWQTSGDLHLTKPVSRRKLLAAVAGALSQRDAALSPGAAGES